MAISPLLYPEGDPRRKEYDDLMASPHICAQTKARLAAAAEPGSTVVGVGTHGDYDAIREQALGEARAGDAADDARQQAYDRLDAQRPPEVGGTGGVRGSDEVLDLAKPALDFFATWIDQVWNAGDGRRVDYMSTIWDRFHENRGIDFRAFCDEAADLARARDTVQQTMDAAQAELNTLFGQWQGAGATAARAKLDEGIKPDAQELLDHLDGALQFIPETLSAIHDVLRDKVDAALQLIRPTVAGAPLDTARAIARVAPGGPEHSPAEFDTAVAFFQAQWGVDLAEVGRNGAVGDAAVLAFVVPLCQAWCEQFTAEFRPLLDAFDELCRTANEAIDGHWHQLARFMDGYVNAFTQSGPVAKAPAAPQPTGGVPATASAGAPPAAAPSPTPTVAPPPPAPSPPPAPEPPAGAPTAPAATEPAAAPETVTDVPMPGDEPQTFTVARGGVELSFSEPGPEGTMTISLDDGSGTAKEFVLDFGASERGTAEPVPEGEQDPAPAEEPGPSDAVHRPGPDGVIHIEEGELRVAAEQPDGPDGATVVTVDDGTGEPATYTLTEDTGETDTEAAPGAEQATTPQAFTAGDLFSGEAGPEVSGAGLGTAPGGNEPAGAGVAGGAGGGGGGGASGDGERLSPAKRIALDLFGGDEAAVRISGSLDEGAERAVRFER
ncbi:WXG100 family type VII secretion target [Qaidamihabitans albus]|uniref:WXG100 family type VII secretion target n=1 Tax=Qaidamihabitans albus TaxID=2795733 RepID=UPI0018F1B187|nr:WXG100 family type VII secretion target [Qaidamihabitans albus]